MWYVMQIINIYSIYSPELQRPFSYVLGRPTNARDIMKQSQCLRMTAVITNLERISNTSSNTSENNLFPTSGSGHVPNWQIYVSNLLKFVARGDDWALSVSIQYVLDLWLVLYICLVTLSICFIYTKLDQQASEM